MPFLTSPRGRFFYREARGNSPLLVFLHGNLGTSRWWRPVLDRLPQGWRGIAYDATGFGYSDATARFDRFTISSAIQDLLAVLSRLADAPIHLIAHSTSTVAAIEFALASQQHLQSLVLVGPVPATGTHAPPEAYPYLERLLSDQSLIRQALETSLPAVDPKSPLFKALLDDAATISTVAPVAISRALDAWQPGERLRDLTLPVLLMRGELDIMLDEDAAAQTLLAIPGANNLEILRGVGHGPMVENPKAFTEVLVRFIAEDRDEYGAIRDSVT